MTGQEKATKCVVLLKQAYPEARCSLVYSDPLQMMIATRLSAQCTDARVNAVTPALFERFPDVHSFANADVKEVEWYIRSCGLYKIKARDICEMCKMILRSFSGNVPDNMEHLLSLPGIGRKTANLVLGDVYGKPAIVTDTHFIRMTKRLGFHNTQNPLKVELVMKKLLPPEESNDFCHRTVLHGRAICTARSPSCSKCCLKYLCTFACGENVCDSDES